MSSLFSLPWKQSYNLYAKMKRMDVDTPDPPRLTTGSRHWCTVPLWITKSSPSKSKLLWILVDPNATTFSIRNHRNVEEIETGAWTREHCPVVRVTSVVENWTSPYVTRCTAVGSRKFSSKSNSRIFQNRYIYIYDLLISYYSS